ncbi:MAG TPA: hypothetical protein VGH32_07745 [Pirellulales bacterium]
MLEATVQVVELPKDFILAMLKISNQDWPDRWSIVHSRMLRGAFCGGRKVCWLVAVRTAGFGELPFTHRHRAAGRFSSDSSR